MAKRPSECFQCLEPFQDEVLLDCLHSVCRPCAVQLAKSGSGKIKCQADLGDSLKCGHVTSVRAACAADGSSLALPPSPLPPPAAAPSSSSEETKKEIVECDGCEMGQPAVVHCADCEASLCAECHAAHNKFKLNKSHKVQPVDQIGKQQQTKQQQAKRRQCVKHTKYEREVYCVTCRQVICTMCVVVEHKSPEHQCHPLSDEVDECGAYVCELVADTTDKQQQVQERLMAVHSKLTVLAESTQLQHNRLDELCDGLIGRVNEQRAHLHDQLKEKSEEQTKLIIDQLDQLGQLALSVEWTRKFASQWLQAAATSDERAMDFVVASEAISERLESVVMQTVRERSTSACAASR